MNPIREALEQSGINASTLDRIRLARGVVGKASYVAGAAILALAGVAWGLRDPSYLLVDAVLIVVVFVVYFGGVLWFANRHPGVALLRARNSSNGAKWISLRNLLPRSRMCLSCLNRKIAVLKSDDVQTFSRRDPTRRTH
jgi:hypothetical protein